MIIHKTWTEIDGQVSSLEMCTNFTDRLVISNIQPEMCIGLGYHALLG